ncbi:hypothetical protein [Rhizobium sp.]|jgi:glycerol dehydrogenase|uniref:hypothetical protein n=1 Tax=Rhizobium sp. TaxID=391 RepID=UPI000E9E392B|nr:hypothetical protein [Rhizobium sp.]
MTPRGYGGPLRYVLGPGVINDSFFWETLKLDIEHNLTAAGVKSHFVKFGGETSNREVARRIAEGKATGAGVVVGIGGGKALEFVREKWNPVFPKRQTKIRVFRVCLVQSEPDRL